MEQYRPMTPCPVRLVLFHTVDVAGMSVGSVCCLLPTPTLIELP